MWRFAGKRGLAAILVLFTDIERSVMRWVSCGPIATPGEQATELCRRQR